LFACRQRVLIGQWPDWSSSAVVLAAMNSRSAAGPVTPVPDTLTVVGAYRIGYSSRTDLLLL